MQILRAFRYNPWRSGSGGRPAILPKAKSRAAKPLRGASRQGYKAADFCTAGGMTIF
ncbi:MAG: hypothetical protein LBK44_06960 [Spirochaetales bacterium]|jgi:hypothetical protein|nr:hypothetical protein [Spirochaetales bacterium]